MGSPTWEPKTLEPHSPCVLTGSGPGHIRHTGPSWQQDGCILPISPEVLCRIEANINKCMFKTLSVYHMVEKGHLNGNVSSGWLQLTLQLLQPGHRKSKSELQRSNQKTTWQMVSITICTRSSHVSGREHMKSFICSYNPKINSFPFHRWFPV